MKKIFLLIVTIIFCSVPVFAGNTEIIPNYVPVSELRNGQILTGYTVVNGILPVKFKAQIIGIKKIVFFDRLRATNTVYAVMKSGPCLLGIVGSMSGSTMCSKDGIIVGLAAAGFVGASPGSPIFMINPMEEILKYAPGENKAEKVRETKAGLSKKKTTLYASSGFNVDILKETMPGFDVNVIANQSSSSNNIIEANKKNSGLQAGSAIAAFIVYGDQQLCLYGTLGYLIHSEKGNVKFGAFGHSCLNKGEVRIPIKQVSVIGLLYRESFLSDFKIIGSVVSDFVGEITYDKFSVYGELYPKSKKEIDIDNITVKQSVYNQQELIDSKKCHVVKIPDMTVGLLKNVLISTMLFYYTNYGIETKTIEYQVSLTLSDGSKIIFEHSFASGSIKKVAVASMNFTGGIFKQLKDTDTLDDLKSIDVNVNFSNVEIQEEKKKLTVQTIEQNK